jgi:predicted GTPase
MEEGNFKPIRTRAAEMASKAQQWSDSTAPALYDKAEIKANIAKPAKESEALAAQVAKKANDAAIKESLNALHDRFHEIAGMCNDAKKQSL